MNIFRPILTCGLVMHLGILFAQSLEVRNNLKVVVDGDTLLSAWAGGMNAPQFSATDLDGDGIKDLVVFDREDDSFRPYVNEGVRGKVSYRYAPDLESIFDSCRCEDWAILIDYDCDGKEDLFCGNNANVDIYRQETRSGKPFYSKVYERIDSDYIDSGVIPLYSGKIDMPAIIDLDEDGDLDFLTWRLGTNYMEWHRNIAQDSFGRCDTIVFMEETYCWGHFSEDNADNTIHIHDTVFCPLVDFKPQGSCLGVNRAHLPPPSDPVEGEKHTGSSTLLLDLNGDQIKEALIGDISFNNMNGLYNCGRIDYAYMDSVDDQFPVYDTPIDLEIFPAAFHVDVNNDEIRDLLVAVNTIEASENFESVIWYRNEGVDDIPDFRFQGHGPLQADNLDLGASSSPAFFDYNGDNLQDLLVGNAGYYNRNTGVYDYALALLENVGTADRPVFKLVDRNYLGVTGGPWPGLARITPTLGDLDGDLDEDLLLGNGFGTLYYFRNVAAPGDPANFQFITDQFDMIDVGTNSAPFLYDFESDGDLDLFIGNEIGKIAFYRNTGTPQSPSFILEEDEFGKVRILDEFGGRFSGNAKPILMDYDGDNKDELLIGTIRGDVEIFEDPDRGLTDSLLSSGILLNYDVGGQAAPTAAVVDSTGSFSYVVGSSRGGLQLFNSLPADPGFPTSISKDAWQGPEIVVFPNPSMGIVKIGMEGEWKGQITLEVFTSRGERLLSQPLNPPLMQIDLQAQPAGLYLLRFHSTQGTLVKKVVLMH